MKLTLPPILETKLADFRQRVWFVKLAEAFLAATTGLTLSYLLVFTLDRFMETPVWLRLLLVASGTAILLLGVPLKWYRWVWKQRTLENAARLLRRTHPRLGDQLLGIVELAKNEAHNAGRSERLVQAAMEQAADAVKDKDFTNAVPNAVHHRWAWATGALLLLCCIAAVFTSEAAKNALARWIAPWIDTERFTFTKIAALPKQWIVPVAEPFELPVRLHPNTENTPPVGSAIIGTQKPVSAPLESGQYTLAFPPQKKDSAISVSIGDLRKSVELLPRPRPEITEISVHLRLPEYLGYKSEQKFDLRAGALNAVKGSEVLFEAKASQDLTSAMMEDVPQAVEGNKIRTDSITVTGDFSRKLFWRDVLGLTPKDPLVLKVRATADEPPRIVAKREALEQVVLDSEVVTFDLTSTDDFGIKTLGLEWVGSLISKSNPVPVRGQKIAAAGDHEKREMAVPATFCATREGVAPQTIEIRAWADDYLPGRPHSYSSAFVLHILNKTDHALWLTEQFGKWIDSAKESYDREQQLHQTNQELRNLSAEELDRPENRRRIAQQAAAENANAARLENLTKAGRSLAEQATRNTEFDAKRLDSWAKTLQALSDIASKRMPNVSDLLKQTANASSAPQSSSPSAQSNAAPSAQPPSSTPPSTVPSTPSSTAAQPQAPQASQSPQTPPPPPASEPAAPKDSAAKQSPSGLAQSPSPNSNAASPASSPSEKKPSLPNLTDNPPSSLPKTPDAAPQPKPPGPDKLSLPGTTLAAAPGAKKEAADPVESPAQKKLDSALAEQKDLLAEFAKVSDQLSSVLAGLESSTFVKRLKEASKQQIRIASDLAQKTLTSFGIENTPPPEAIPIAQFVDAQTELVRVIQSDLDAYFVRKQDNRFKKVLDEMKKSDVVRLLSLNREKLLTNLTGQTLTGAEYWADTLDRWAEELVAAASNGKSSPADSASSNDSLPPEIILKVMQALRDEMKLRDETREAENAKPAVEITEFEKTAQVLTKKQTAINEHTKSAIADILELSDGGSKFPKELQLLNEVVTVMNDATNILKTPDTGAPAVAAETEAIELLLQTKRNSSKPSSAGGGSSSAGEGNRAAAASSAALSNLGPGPDAKSTVTARPVGQSTGHAGKEFPAEFKAGLDAYFNLLEGAKK